MGTYSVANYDEYNRTGDTNLFERVIDELMLDNISISDEIKEKIKYLPSKDRRLNILAFLENDRNLFMKINKILKEKKSSFEYLKEIMLLMRDYVKIADVERKKHGEILTPFSLAKDMVNLVDKYDDDFWKNPNHKVLDSSAGYGTFLILAAYKFMNGLKGVIKDEEKRFKWIVENCLYYGELQAKSVFSWLMIIDPYDKYKTNTYWGSFLTEDFNKHAKEVWKVEKWDLIIQNPPYQTRQEGNKKTQPLWHLFVQKSLTLLGESRYMVMVHPSGWRNVDGIFKDTQNLLKNRQILELNINDERKGEEIFGATTGFDYYILKNSQYLNKTLIISDDVKSYLDLKKYEFIPGSYFEIYNKLIANENDKKVNILYSRSSYGTDKSNMNREKIYDFIYPCVYTVQKDETINLFWSNTYDKGHFNIPKVIWSNGKASTPIVDIDGIYGLTQFSYAIVDDVENLNNIKKAMCSEKFQNFMKSCDMNNGNRFNKKVLSMFKKDFWKEFI